jgi:hypothetical protein
VTAALGYALSRAPSFAAELLSAAGATSAPTEIRLEQADGGFGRPDLELVAGETVVLLEAKLGFAEPSMDQIDRYARILADRRSAGTAATTALVITSAWPDDLALPRLPPVVHGSTVTHLSWQTLAALAERARPAETRGGRMVLDDLGAFLRSVIAMSDTDSNLVYVVSLGHGGPPNGGVTWRSVVTDRHLYWHKVGGDRSGWPVIPPNYIGFRWEGRLREVRHVEGHQLFRDPHDLIDDIPSEDWGPHVSYSLGPPILPQGAARATGLWPNGRYWAALDLLLLCDTIAEARDLTSKRRAAGGLLPAVA